jgi:predicted dehydrogenase
VTRRAALKAAACGLGNRLAAVVEHLLRAAGGRIALVGWSDPSPAGLPHLEQRGIRSGRGYDDPERMIAAERPDLLLVGSPNHLHLEHIEAGLAAGCRVLSEKPVVIDAEQTWRLARLLARHGHERVLVSGLVLRSAPLTRAVRGLLAQGRLGRLVSVEANEHLNAEHGGALMRNWRRRREWAGSYLLEKCCHDFDIYQALVGARAARVASFGGRDIFVPANAELEAPRAGKKPYRSWSSGWNGIDRVFDSDADVFDHQVAMVQYANGVRLAFHSNTHSAFHQRRWLLAGTHATLECDLATARLRVAGIHGVSEDIPVDTGTSHYGADAGMADDICAHLFEAKPFPVRVVEALEAGLTCMAIDEAARTGTVVDCAPWFARLDRELGGTRSGTLEANG